MSFQKIRSFVWETAKLVFISLVIILPIRYFLVEPFFVLGASMEPTFQNGDYLVINEISYLTGKPNRGDVVVFQYPHNPKECESIVYQFTHSKNCPYYIKRVIALPGETVILNDRGVLIKNAESPDGFFLKEEYLANKKTYDGKSAPARVSVRKSNPLLDHGNGKNKKNLPKAQRHVRYPARRPEVLGKSAESLQAYRARLRLRPHRHADF